jgi:alpha-L-fucosidase
MKSKWQNRLVKTAVIGPRIAAEVTPFVLNGRLYRVENHPRHFDFKGVPPDHRYHEDEIRIRDVEADRIVSTPLRDHYFGAGFVWEGRFHLFAADGRGQPWYEMRRIVTTSSADLQTWTEPRVVIESENDEHVFNTAVCRGRDRFILLYETDDRRWQPKFTFKYCESDDLVSWKRIPDAIYGRGKYVGGPALYYEGGWYYTLYLQSLSGSYETHVTRSTDLIHLAGCAHRSSRSHLQPRTPDRSRGPSRGSRTQRLRCRALLLEGQNDRLLQRWQPAGRPRSPGSRVPRHPARDAGTLLR